jgi:hypothetical protein
MNDPDLHLAYGWGAVVCVFGLILNLAKVKKRGKSAKLLAIAFVLLGVALALMFAGVPVAFVTPIAAAVGGILLYDATLRIGQPSKKQSAVSRNAAKNGGRR